MRRLATYLNVAALGFLVGLLAHMLWWGSFPISEINKPLAVSLCELELNPERYNGKIVQVKAVLYRNQGEPFISDESCKSSNAHMSRLVMVSDDTNLFPVLPRWATYTSFCGNDPYPALVNGMSAEVLLLAPLKQVISRQMTLPAIANRKLLREMSFNFRQRLSNIEPHNNSFNPTPRLLLFHRSLLLRC